MHKKIVYPELEAGLLKREIRKKEVSEFLGIVPETLSKKLSGKNSFTLDEAFAIHSKWFNDISIEKLFQKNRGEDNDRDNQTDGM